MSYEWNLIKITLSIKEIYEIQASHIEILNDSFSSHINSHFQNINSFLFPISGSM